MIGTKKEKGAQGTHRDAKELLLIVINLNMKKIIYNEQKKNN